jgi:diacylglycerol kinase (ATP)
MNARAPMEGVRNGAPFCQRVALGRDGERGEPRAHTEPGQGDRWGRTAGHGPGPGVGRVGGAAWPTTIAVRAGALRFSCPVGGLGSVGVAQCRAGPETVQARDGPLARPRSIDGLVDTIAGPRPPLVLMNPRAARLTDERRRATVRHEVELAVHARFGQAPDWAPETHHGALHALQDVTDRAAVVAVGGDGTVREVADALVGTDIPLAIVPGGTGNVLAGTLGLGGIGGAMRVIRTGASRRLDLGCARWGAVGDAHAVHERRFTVACGMGFDARVMAAAEHEWKRRLRFGAYIGAAVREAVRLRPAAFHIEADGAVIDIIGLVVLVANCGELVPGRVGMREPLDPTDGRLDLIVIGGRDVLRGLRGAADVLLRTGELDGSVIRRFVRQVRVEADPAQPTQTDGDVHPAGWLDVAVLPGALHVLVPSGTA